MDCQFIKAVVLESLRFQTGFDNLIGFPHFSQAYECVIWVWEIALQLLLSIAIMMQSCFALNWI